MTGWAEMPTLAGECQQVFMVAILAFYMGKAFVQIAAIQIPTNNLLKIRTQKSVFP